MVCELLSGRGGSFRKLCARFSSAKSEGQNLGSVLTPVCVDVEMNGRSVRAELPLWDASN